MRKMKHFVRGADSAVLMATAVAMVVGSTWVGGCGDEPEAPPVPAAEEAPAEDPAVLSDRQLNAKIGPLISDCLNTFDRSVGGSRSRYLGWIDDDDAGPTGEERGISGLFEISGDLEDCQTAIQASNAPPADPGLHAAATAYGAALVEVIAKVSEAYPYYERENYADDDFAQGRAMHPGLMAAFNRFRAASSELKGRTGTVNRGLTERRIERLASDPQRAMQVMVERHLLLSSDILTTVQDWGVEDGQLTGIDGEALTAQVAELETLTDQLSAAFADGGDAHVENSVYLRSYVGDAGAMLNAAKALMRRVRDNEALSTAELSMLSASHTGVVTGAPPAVIKEYNAMIDEYNRVRWVH